MTEKPYEVLFEPTPDQALHMEESFYDHFGVFGGKKLDHGETQKEQPEVLIEEKFLGDAKAKPRTQEDLDSDRRFLRKMKRLSKHPNRETYARRRVPR